MAPWRIPILRCLKTLLRCSHFLNNGFHQGLALTSWDWSWKLEYTSLCTRWVLRKLNTTPSVSNYFSLITGILRNLWGICKNAQVVPDLDLNWLSNEVFCTQNKAVTKKIWWSCLVFRSLLQDMLWCLSCHVGID